jgi:transcriptional repressor NrdR
MRCPVCNDENTKVVDSRESGEGFSVRRRRECEKCDHRFSTFEEVEILDLALVKRDGRKEPYSREKLESGLKKALQKRPLTPERFKALVGSIERDLQKIKKDEIASLEVGEIVMRHLRTFDSVAYIRFASVYRSFADLKTFQDELKKLAVNKE